jgi:hypothetical protein
MKIRDAAKIFERIGVAGYNKPKRTPNHPTKSHVVVAKEGDMVNSGALIAQLDSYDIQKRLESALNTYRSTRDSFDQYGDNQNSGVAQGSKKYSLETQNKASLGSDQKINVINDRNIYNDMLFKALDENKKIIMPVMSESEAIFYEMWSLSFGI